MIIITNIIILHTELTISIILCTYSAALTTFCQVFPSEYAYDEDSVYRTERRSTNCINYPPGLSHNVYAEHYVHCNGTQLKLTDSYIGSDQYNRGDYYVWPAGTRSSQLLFIFPTRVNLTTITLHYYSNSGRGLPRLRFYAVSDDFDVWDAPSSSNSHVDVAAVPPGAEPAGPKSVSIATDIRFKTNKVLLYKFSSDFKFTLSEVEFTNRYGKV